MDNPWELSRIQYFNIHPDDERFVGQHNRRANADTTIQRLLPALPYVGNPKTARVILLGKNPSYSTVDDTDSEQYPAIMDENVKALTFESNHPFFYLDPRFTETAGYKWWWKTLERLVLACQEKGVERDTTLERIACIQLHPYRSKKSFIPNEPFPTQNYGFYLATQAASRGALFVIQYGTANERLWRELVPALPADAIRLRSPQTPDLSPGNMPPADFERLVATLTA